MVNCFHFEITQEKEVQIQLLIFQNNFSRWYLWWDVLKHKKKTVSILENNKKIIFVMYSRLFVLILNTLAAFVLFRATSVRLCDFEKKLKN